MVFVYEQTALEGAREIISKGQPLILFEVSMSALRRHARAPKDVYNFLRDQKKRFVRLSDTPDGNVIALPMSQTPASAQ
jgi:hypothetical protein